MSTKKYTIKPTASGLINLTGGQIARWFIEAYKEEFDDQNSPLYGQSAEAWQSIVNFLNNGVKPDQEDQLFLQIVQMFEREWLPLFTRVE